MKRRWVIPDTHGCVKTVEALFANIIKPARYDEIWFLGDYIDRGPNSKGVIDFIRHLQKDEYNVTALKGNHEDMFFSFSGLGGNYGDMFLFNGGQTTLTSYGIPSRKSPTEMI